ncbi:MAG: PD40 domain-containing protein [Bacteroidia bacterium]|nr:PD40 domain-containing protein [Bacteroidia bacterium]
MKATLRLALVASFVLNLGMGFLSAQKKDDKLSKEQLELLSKAEYFFEEKNYLRALPLFNKLRAEKPAYAYFHYRAGICYLYKSDEKEGAIPALLTADSLDNSLEDIKYYLGRAYHLNYKFDDAISLLNDFLKKNPKSKLAPTASRYVEHSNNGKILVNEDLEVEVEISNIGSIINTGAGEYVPVISADQSVMIFTYRGEKSTGGLQDLKFRPDPEGEYYEDVFISQVVKEKWTTPAPIGPSINTTMHDAAIALSPDGQKLFIFKSTAKDRGDIFMSSLNGSVWGAPVRLGSTINTKYWEGSVSISADGNLLYFASERPGGFGGRDLYRSKKMADGNWGPAENLGPGINTPYNDDAPFIHPDGITLFFSSQGHNSIGGYDVMYSVLKDNSWTTPTNLGYPINTTEDDIYYVLSADGETGYYASNRKGGFGQQDIYTIQPGFLGEKPVLALVFGVVSSIDNKPVNATISVSNNQTGENVGTYESNSSTGKYLVALTPGSEYKVAFEFEGMQPHIEYVDVKKLDTYIQVEHDIKMKPVGDLSVQDSTNTLQKKMENQIDKYYLEAKSEFCYEKVFNRLLEKYGTLVSPDVGYHVEMGTFENSSDFRSEKIRDLGTIKSEKDPFNNTTFFFGPVSTLIDANALVKEIRKRDTTYKALQITVRHKADRRVLYDFFNDEYKKGGCAPPIPIPVIAQGLIQGLDDKNYQNLVKDNGDKQIEGLHFKVEIASVTDTNDFKLQHWEKYGKIEKKLFPDGKYRYSFGPFKTLQDAEEFKKVLISKEPDSEKSIITVFVFGERKTLDEWQDLPCKSDFIDFAWFVGKDLNDVTVYKKLIETGGNFCTDGLVFKVQIGAYRFPQNFKYPTVEEFGPAEIIAYPDGITRFTMKQFTNLKDAEKFRQIVIKRGITDAWITAVYKGERVLLTDLIKVNFYGKAVN